MIATHTRHAANLGRLRAKFQHMSDLSTTIRGRSLGASRVALAVQREATISGQTKADRIGLAGAWATLTAFDRFFSRLALQAMRQTRTATRTQDPEHRTPRLGQSRAG